MSWVHQSIYVHVQSVKAKVFDIDPIQKYLQNKTKRIMLLYFVSLYEHPNNHLLIAKYKCTHAHIEPKSPYENIFDFCRAYRDLL